MACNQTMGVGEGTLIGPPNPNRHYAVSQARIVEYDETVKKMILCLKCLLDIHRHTNGDDPRKDQALFCANQCINMIDLEDKKSIEGALNHALSFLNPNCNNPVEPKIYAIGHCHIDTAWLWTYGETRRKTARSWASQIELMARYPDFKFVCSQTVQLEWLKLDYPDLFKKLQEYAKRGQFIPVGGTYVEQDGNMPCGESMIRQFLYGQAFLKQNFGACTRVFWLPDTFGYAGQLPQIMKHCGIDYFVTQKLSWNNINPFPHSTFMWTAIDGRSQVLTHFPPANTYGASVDVKECLDTVRLNKDKDRCPYGLLVYGHGDGGGGPTEEMVVKVDLLKNAILPHKIIHGDSVDFFKLIEKDKNVLLTWKGELYFELHRGTFTSQAACKQYNRQLELALKQCEFLLVYCHCTSGVLKDESRVKEYRDELTACWKVVLLNQFHDVLPGSSIEQVYKDARAMYSAARYRVDKMILDLASLIAQAYSETIIINTCPFDRLIDGAVVPAFGCIVQQDQTGKENREATIQTIDPHFILEDERLKCAFDHQGRLVSFYDKMCNREYIKEAGNEFVLFEDMPGYWDAWDVELYHLEKPVVVLGGSITKHHGHLERRVRIKESCVAIQKITLHDGRLEFNTRVIDWAVNFKHKILKVRFGLDVLADQALYETAFGQVSRPTGQNTSHDVAKFEVCGHRFAVLKEPMAGVALLSDSKYGYSITDGSTLHLSLLRAPTHPDAHGDEGDHHFKYALCLAVDHEYVQQAISFTTPLIRRQSLSPQVGDCNQTLIQESFIKNNNQQSTLIIDGIKPCEQDPNAFIVRLYESIGARGQADIQFRKSLKIKQVLLADGLENVLDELDVDNHVLSLIYRPFEIISLKVVLFV